MRVTQTGCDYGGGMAGCVGLIGFSAKLFFETNGRMEEHGLSPCPISGTRDKSMGR